MADPKAMEKLAGIDRKLADLTELGKQMAAVRDPAEAAALQARFRELSRAFEQQVKAISEAFADAGLVKRDTPVRIDLDPAEVQQIYAATGELLGFIELPTPPPRALTREEVMELALGKARAQAEARGRVEEAEQGK